ncbi:hypothetical protein SCP_0300360 [Sparassis crispa]|uniref:Uncharacterized protein n=1 Tax=Sparassis crispa TaxID=139825 RepID=A0A401GDV9_9APHY|nr:hypothetical protein SCP_0300360 [Sparassis crispa]GBE80321.1 hypothetical protein SCP_0300360 [Sparassis crispa]
MIWRLLAAKGALRRTERSRQSQRMPSAGRPMLQVQVELSPYRPPIARRSETHRRFVDDAVSVACKKGPPRVLDPTLGGSTIEQTSLWDWICGLDGVSLKRGSSFVLHGLDCRLAIGAGGRTVL